MYNEIMEITEKVIEDVLQKILDHANPEMVVLFGSYAWGAPTRDSDLDLLVVKKSELRRDERALEISRLFANRMFPIDIIVYTPDEVGQYQKIEGSFIKDILENGRVLYDRAA